MSLKNEPKYGKVVGGTDFRDRLNDEMRVAGDTYQRLNNELRNDPNYALPEERREQMRRKLAKRTVTTTYKKAFARAVLITLLSILIIGTCVLSVSSLRDRAINFLLSLSGSYGEILYISDSTLVYSNIQFPTTLPDGYNLSAVKTIGDKNSITDDVVVTLEYTNPDLLLLSFTRCPLTNTAGSVDTENAEIKEVMINGIAGQLINTENAIALHWQSNKFSFALSSNDTSIDLVSVAESVPID